MRSPFQQKYSSQHHRYPEDHTTPIMPHGPNEDAQRRASDSSTTSTNSTSSSQSPGYHQYRRGSDMKRFEEFKRPHEDGERSQRRASLQDSYGKPGIFGTMWNSWTRGPLATTSTQQPPKQANKKEPRDITTLRSE